MAYYHTHGAYDPKYDNEIFSTITKCPTIMHIIIKQIPKRPRLCPVCEFTTANRAALFMGIGELRGGKMGANGKMQYNPGWESGSMKTLGDYYFC
jgi:hypothetical protein